MVRRRTFLWALLGAAAGCRPNGSNELLRIKLLSRSIPAQVLKVYGRQTSVKFESEASLADIYRYLQQRQPTGAQNNDTHLVTLSDPWLSHAIRQDLIQPLPDFALADTLPVPWQRLLRPDQQGQSTALGKLWALPYRTQGLMIAYQKPIFQTRTKPLTKWADLWRPELAGRIAMPNQPRLIAAIVLQALGYSVNDEAALARKEFKEQLFALYRQVRVFDSLTHLKALVNEDVWLAVGWSGDILATLVRYRRLGAIQPQEGTVLTSDLWVAPKGVELTQAVQLWMEFCWQLPIATQISLSSYGVAPLFLLPDADVPALINQQPLIVPQNGEVILPFSTSGQATLAELFNPEVYPE